MEEWQSVRATGERRLLLDTKEQCAWPILKTLYHLEHAVNEQVIALNVAQPTHLWPHYRLPLYPPFSIIPCAIP